jgi:hypothetical protein
VIVPKTAFALLLALATVGCAADPQPTAGLGWRLIEVRGGNVSSGIDVVPLGIDALVVSVAVSDGCAGGGGKPVFVGFESRGDALVAVIKRSAITADCISTRNVVFDLELAVPQIPAGTTRLALGGDACVPEDTVCRGVSTPIPLTLPTPGAPVPLSAPP